MIFPLNGTKTCHEEEQVQRRPDCFCAEAGLTNSSLAIRSSTHNGFSVAILRIRLRSSGGIGGRPALHFERQKIRQPSRCQRTMVDGRTLTTALRQSKSLEN